MKKRIISLFLCFSIMLSIFIPCSAAETVPIWKLDLSDLTPLDYTGVFSSVLLTGIQGVVGKAPITAYKDFTQWMNDCYGKTTVTDKDPKLEIYNLKLLDKFRKKSSRWLD